MESCSIVLESHPIFSVFDEAVTFAVKKEDAEANFLQVRIGLDVLGSFIVSFLTLYLEWVFSRINCHYIIPKKLLHQPCLQSRNRYTEGRHGEKAMENFDVN